jgi:hypothetical protein
MRMEDGSRRRRHDESRRMERMEGEEMGYLGCPSTFISSCQLGGRPDTVDPTRLDS